MTPGNLLTALMSSGGASADGTLLKAFTLNVGQAADGWGGYQYGYYPAAYGGLSPAPLVVSGKTIAEIGNYYSTTFPEYSSLKVVFASSVDVAFRYMLLDGVKYFKSTATTAIVDGKYTYQWMPDTRLVGKQGQSVPVAFYL